MYLGYYALPFICLLFIVPCIWSMLQKTDHANDSDAKAIIVVLLIVGVIVVQQMWWALMDTPFCNVYRDVCALILILISVGVCKLAS